MAYRSPFLSGILVLLTSLLVAQKTSQEALVVPSSEPQFIEQADAVQQETIQLTLPSSETENHAAPSLKTVKPRKRDPQLLRVVDQQDIEPRHRQIANDLLESIDSGCKNALLNFYVRYDNPNQRGLGGGSTIIVTGNTEDDEFRALVIHECGHVIDTGFWQGTISSGTSAFVDGSTPVYNDDLSIDFYAISWTSSTEKNQGWKPSDFVSGYAVSDPFEDFAETFAYFSLQRDAFEKRAETNSVIRQKLEFMKAHVNSKKVAQGKSVWNGEVPWDITRLPYTWLGSNTNVVSR